MNPTVTNCLSGLKPGELQQTRNMGMVPLFHPAVPITHYISLKEAMEQRSLLITEVSHGGHVPSLLVVNKGSIPVLLLDGEELEGAKQNRVLHDKLVRSYALEALLQQDGKEHKIGEDLAEKFFNSLVGSEEKKYKSVGLGDDYRYRADRSVGSALVYQDEVIHMAFFAFSRESGSRGMSDFDSRRDFRRFV